MKRSQRKINISYNTVFQMKKWYPNSNDENDEDYEDQEYDDGDDEESYDDCEQGDENDEFNSELIIVSYCNNFVYV